MINYSILLERLFQLNLFGGTKLGLSNCLKMSAALGFPERSLRFIHVAGTNGKGSVTTKIARALELEGYLVGLYTSPHISSFRERITINQNKISEAEVEQGLELLFSIKEVEQIPCTFFEMTTLLAFLYFARHQVDYVVLETGLGGRLDATNIVTPLLSVITSIALEHTDILGKDIESIATEKGGIIKPDIPVVVGPRTPHALFQEMARFHNCPFYAIDQTFEDFEQENKAIAGDALKLLNCSSESIVKGLMAAPPCRFEIFSKDPPVILDVAHNPDGLNSLLKKIGKVYPDFPLHIVFGLSKTKDISSCLSLIVKSAHSIFPVEAPNGRGIPVEELMGHFLKLGTTGGKLYTQENISASVQEAINQARANKGLVLICGSFFIMSEARQALGIVEETDPMDMNERSFAFGVR